VDKTSYETQYHQDVETAPVKLDGKTQVLNLDYKTAGLLCYVPICAINLVASLVFLNSEPKENRFVRFHAMQSLVMMIAYMVVGIAVWTVSLILGFIPIVGTLISFLANLVWLAASVLFIWQSVVGIIAASKGELKHIPYAGQIAEERLAQ
jgi:uncharacterized membrane protein